MNIREFLKGIRFGVLLKGGRAVLARAGTLNGEVSADVEGFSFRLAADFLDDSTAKLRLTVSNKRGAEVRDVVVAVIPFSRDYTYFKNGYQSWSLSRPVRLGKEERKLWLPVPSWTRYARMTHYYREDEPKSCSHYFTAVRGGDTEAVLGFTTFEHYHPYFVMKRGELWALNAVDLAREEIVSEELFIKLSSWHTGFLEYGRLLPRRRASGVYGWCSWYYYYRKIDQEKISEALAGLRERGIPIQIFQVDDGYQRAIGDWLTLDERKFSWSLKGMAEAIEREGYSPGIWLAPFLVSKKSEVFRNRRDWLLRDSKGRVKPVLYNVLWEGGVVYALDLSNDEVLDWLREVISSVVAAGFRYLKLDFLYAGMVEGVRKERDLTRVEVYRKALEVIRKSAGDDVYLLGCGAPIGESLGFFDGMRIGPDTDKYWAGNPGVRLVRALFGFWAYPNMRDSVRNTIHRWMLNASWNNDPDVLVLRRGVKENLIRLQVTTYFLLGSHIMFSDPPEKLTEYGLEAYVKALPPLERRGYVLDAGRGEVDVVVAESGGKKLVGLLNSLGRIRSVELDLTEFARSPFAIEFWTGRIIGTAERVNVAVPPRDARLLVISDVAEDALFLGTTIDLGQRIRLLREGEGVSLAADLPGRRRGLLFLRRHGATPEVVPKKGNVLRVSASDDVLVVEVEAMQGLEILIRESQ